MYINIVGLQMKPISRKKISFSWSLHLLLHQFVCLYFILFYFILFVCLSVFYFILFYFILFVCLSVFYFILFYFILFYFILFYFILFYCVFYRFCCFYCVLLCFGGVLEGCQNVVWPSNVNVDYAASHYCHKSIDTSVIKIPS